MDEIETTATSSKTADVSPIELRKMERVRLVFKPTLVENAENPRACIRGEFVYERKAAGGEWTPANELSLGTIRSGEQYKLDLHSSELLTLMEALMPMYREFFNAKGLPSGRKKYVLMENGLALFLRQSHDELNSFLNAHSTDAATVLSRLLQWTDSGATSEVTSKLAAMAPEQMPALSALFGLSALKSAVAYWEENRSNEAEGFWQEALSRYAFVLGQLFAQPVVMVNERAYLGGKDMSNSGGSYSDFLGKAMATGALAIIEIKTPSTRLLGQEYRTNAFPASTELAGAIAQVLKYRHTLSTTFPVLKLESEKDMVLGNPPCFVIIGDSAELRTTAMKESFEAFRSELANVHVLTYDELFERTRTAAELLEGTAKIGGQSY